MSYRKVKYSPDKTTNAVNYLVQYAKMFVAPYGEADAAPDKASVFRKLKPFNCEWMLRPKVAMSEFSATLLENNHLFQHTYKEVQQVPGINQMTSAIKALSPVIDSLHKDSVNSPTKKDVDVMKFFLEENDELDEASDTCFHIGNAMFSTATNMIVTRNLIRNPRLRQYGSSSGSQRSRL